MLKEQELEQKKEEIVEKVKESPAPEKKTYDYKKSTYKKKETAKVEVILISRNYVVIKDKNGCCMRKYGAFPDVKVGDFISI